MKYYVTIALILAITFGVWVHIAKASSVNIVASEDSQIYSTSPDANYGSVDIPIVGFRSDYGIYRAVYKFNVSIPSGSKITGATLTIGTYDNYFGSPANTGVYQVADDSWTENGVTWNNQPTAGALIQSFSTSYNAGSQAYNVTSFVTNQVGSGGGSVAVSFMQKVINETIATGIRWRSRENTGLKPTLNIIYTSQSGTKMMMGSSF